MIYEGARVGVRVGRFHSLWPIGFDGCGIDRAFDYSACTQGPWRERHVDLRSEPSGAPRHRNEAKLPE